MRKILFILLVVQILFIAPAYSFTLSNFETPESMVVDPQTGYYYVSNVNGGLTDRDGNGYISKINPKGDLVIQRFIGGKKVEPVLDAPKGLAIVGENIAIADIDTVKIIDKNTADLVSTVNLALLGAKFLNDIAYDGQNTIYVSDTFTNQIFKIDTKKNYQATVYKSGPELGSPNGLMVNPKSKNLMVVTWDPGEILEIDRAGKVHVLKKGQLNLDGIDYDNQGNIYVSNFEKGEIYRVSNFGRGAMTSYLSGLNTPADISFDRKKAELLIPSTKGNSVSVLPKK